MRILKQASQRSRGREVVKMILGISTNEREKGGFTWIVSYTAKSPKNDAGVGI